MLSDFGVVERTSSAIKSTSCRSRLNFYARDQWPNQSCAFDGGHTRMMGAIWKHLHVENEKQTIAATRESDRT
jgi:hypothetical protein